MYCRSAFRVALSGIYRYPDGNVYDGEWRDDVRHGRGVFKWASGAQYDGEWRDGKRTGRGTFCWPDGDVYEGDWRDGVQQGRGRLTQADGRQFEGSFAADAPTAGIYFDPAGAAFDVVFRAGEHLASVAVLGDEAFASKTPRSIPAPTPKESPSPKIALQSAALPGPTGSAGIAAILRQELQLEDSVTEEQLAAHLEKLGVRSKEDLRLLDREEVEKSLGLSKLSLTMVARKRFLKLLKSSGKGFRTGLASPAVPLPEGRKHHAFLSHTWLADETGKDTHARAAVMNQLLQIRGFITWFDADKMQGCIDDEMCRGIDSSAVFVVCVTRKYMRKVGGDDLSDNCKKEFLYASRRLTAARMLPVVMEECMLKTELWEGPLGMHLGANLYCPLLADVENEAAFQTEVDGVAAGICKMLAI